MPKAMMVKVMNCIPIRRLSSATSFTAPSEVNGKPVTAIFRLAFQNNSTLQSVTVACQRNRFQGLLL